MSQLDFYLQRKTAAIAARHADWTQDRSKSMVRISASSKLAGNTGARPTQMGAHTLVSDSAPGMAGHGMGPTAPEMLLGALASCLLHTYVIQACLLNIPFDHAEISIEGALDMGTVIGMDGDTAEPLLTDLQYTATLVGVATPQAEARLHAAVETTCPVLNTLRQPVEVRRKA
jgi:uncharacterized OsmC-like protein